jgi:hypothetical protein
MKPKRKPEQTSPSSESHQFSDPRLLEQVRKLVAERDKLLKLEQRTLEDLTEASAAQVAASEAYGDAQVTALVRGENPVSEIQRERLEQASAEVVKLRAQLQAIRRALCAQESDLGTLSERLTSTQVDWAETVWQAFLREQYHPACQAFRQVLEKAQSVAGALGLANKLPLPEDLAISPVEDDPKLKEPFELRKRLYQFQRELDSAHRMEYRFKQLQDQFADVAIDAPLYRFRLNQTVSGKLYQKGEMISRESLHPGLLKLLVKRRAVLPVNPKEAIE